MKRIRLIFVLIALLGIVTACYKEELAALHNQIDNFTSVHINPIETQVEKMSESLETLRSAHSVLQSDMQSLLTIKTALESELSDVDMQLEELLDKIVGDTESVAILMAEREQIAGKLAIIEQAIENLKSKDSELGQRITELESNLAESIDSTRTWAEQSFANLKEYEKTAELVGAIAGDLEALKTALSESLGDISTSLDDSIFEVFSRIGQEYRDAIAQARQELEKLMDDKDLVVHNWVLDTLGSGYYDMAATDQLLADLKAGVVAQFSNGDTTLLRNIDSVRTELYKAKQDLTDAYTQYIDNAISGISAQISDLGNIRTTLHKADSTATKTASDLSDLAGRVKTIEETVLALENVVQSVVFVPDYDDGRIFIPSESSVDVKLRYKINTNNASFDPKNYTITGDLVEAMAATKASYAGTPVTFKNISYSNSVLECTFNTGILPSAFYSGAKSAALSLNISDGKTDISSAYIGLRLQGSGSGTGGGGGEEGGGDVDPDDPVGSFRVSPSSFHVGVSGGDIEAKAICVSDFRWHLDNINYSEGSGTGWVDVQVSADRSTGGGLTGYYEGRGTIYILVSSTSVTTERSAVITFKQSPLQGDATATITITQSGREAQDLTFDPMGITSSTFEFDWDGKRTDQNGTEYQFTVTPTDQLSDWSYKIEPSSAESWLKISATKIGGGARVLTVSADPRSKSVNGYYKDVHEAVIRVTPRTGQTYYDIRVKQNFRPDGKLTFNPDDMEIHFAWDEYGSGDAAYKFTISPEDKLRDWDYEQGTTAFTNFDNLFNGTGFDRSYHNINTGESDMTVYPKAINLDFEHAKTGVVTFVSASGQSSYPMTFTQDKRPAQVLEFDKEDTFVDFTWDQYIAGTTDKTYSIKVTPKDGQNDWPEPEADVDWITVTRGNVSRTDGSATVSISVDVSRDAAKSGNVTFKSADGQTARTITVNQASRPEQTLTITSNPDQDYSIPWDAKKTYTLTVTSSDNFGDWTCDRGDAAFQAAFDVTVGQWRDNKAEVTITAKEPNTSLSENKSGQISFTPATGGTPTVFTFTQSPRSDAQMLTITGSPDENYTFSWKAKDNGTYTISVDPSDDTGDWTCTPDENFEKYFTVSNANNRDASGNGSITIGAKGNNRSTSETLSAQISFAPATGGAATVLTFYQTPCNSVQTFTEATPVDGSTLVFKKDGKIRGSNSTTSYSIVVTTSDGLDDWTYDADEDWIIPEKRNGSLIVSVTGANNTGADRSGTVTIHAANGDAALTYTVIQAKDNLFWIEKGTTSNKTCSFTLHNNSDVNGKAKISWTGNGFSVSNIAKNQEVGASADFTLSSTQNNNGTVTATFTLSGEGWSETVYIDITRSGLISKTYEFTVKD